MFIELREKIAAGEQEIQRLRAAIERSARQLDGHGVREAQKLREALKPTEGSDTDG